ncbi:hypothetical protein K9N68_11770 [Kovacikia minuta CCNUW1]|uniref:hypothetical protein n=1 Tax=Kovacikia minuta TaxID=2931930 RepID=UPI001CCD9AFC|nr:hypothetical protein [Kovacikia minuta]UBF28486.1 hypothetical protein K9N68_11770 [Kovacikia minuta CCNUW1]
MIHSQQNRAASRRAMGNRAVNERVLGIFPTQTEAAVAFDQLVLSGFPVQKVFLVGEDFINAEAWDINWLYELVAKVRRGAIAGTPLDLKQGLIVGSLAGSTIGLLLGLSILMLSHASHAGQVYTIALLCLSMGICTVFVGLAGALIGLHFSTRQAQEDARRLTKGDLLLVVKGTEAEITCAERVLHASADDRRLPVNVSHL